MRRGLSRGEREGGRGREKSRGGSTTEDEGAERSRCPAHNGVQSKKEAAPAPRAARDARVRVCRASACPF